MVERASSHAVSPEASALQAEHDRHALALGIAVVQLEAMEPLPIRPVCAMVGTIRVMQFNILADGLSDDGFLMRDCLQDPETNAIEFSDLLSQVVAARKVGGDSMEKLKVKLSTERSIKNCKALMAWDRRWAQIRRIVAVGSPDIICFQEMDHMADAERDLANLGYVCSLPDRAYLPAHAHLPDEGKLRDPKAFLELLNSTGVAFVPKTNSNCRKFGRATREDADNDGCAIFWRASAFAVDKMDFLAFDNPKRNKGAVKVVLTRLTDGRQLAVICTHLESGSGDKEEAARLKEVTENSLSRSGKIEGPSVAEWYRESSIQHPTLLCLDMNTSPDRSEPQVWRALRGMELGVRSAWDDWVAFDGTKRRLSLPTSTNKMRGPLSNQAKKMGEHAYGLVDHIFFGPDFTLKQHAWEPLVHGSVEKAHEQLLPSLEIPSDHLPVIVDVLLPPRTVDPQLSLPSQGLAHHALSAQIVAQRLRLNSRCSASLSSRS